MGIAFVAAMVRYVYGIGAISDLSNSYPWGFWISFDLFTGVAIGSGAFVMAAIVYIFELKEFRPLVRPAVLTGFLGYIMVVVALLVDLGHPERIWYMMIHWNHTSVLLEIGICVMSYLTVLAIEFAPVVFEGLKWQRAAHFLHRFIMPFVILGVVLSTLHQSSLGSLLLIQPAKLYPLWWTPILPILFFVSAVAIGMAMIIFEASVSARYFHRAGQACQGTAICAWPVPGAAVRSACPGRRSAIRLQSRTNDASILGGDSGGVRCPFDPILPSEVSQESERIARRRHRSARRHDSEPFQCQLVRRPAS